jgi:hypothetical protein
MKHLIPAILMIATAWSCAQQADEIPSPDAQITTALLPLGEAEKVGAMVYGYDRSGSLLVLRKGTGNMVCIADDPKKEGISVACYAKALEPFMARGRQLSAQGMDSEKREAVREQEVASGKLKMPDAPSMMYVYYGKQEDYNPATGMLDDGKFRYVVYIPFATTTSTGLPDKPHANGMPWLMDPGTHKAHIMIGPFE